MFLNIFENISAWFKSVGERISFENLNALLIGIVIGILICILVYLVAVFGSFKKDEKQLIKKNKIVDDEIINRIITNGKNQFMEESSIKKTNEKLNDLKNISWQIVNDIAKEYYPNSSHPIYELSIDELILLNHYITDRIDSIFTGPILKRVKRVKIASVLKIIDVKKKYDENKVVKAANKVKLGGFIKSALVVLNVVNPIYWLKKVLLDAPFVAASTKIGLIIIEVVGEETNKVYSKNVFEKNDNIDSSIKEIEDMLSKEEKQEE